MTLSCVSAWAQAAIDRPGPPRMIIRNEVWRQLRLPAMVAKVDSDLRLSRNDGAIQVLATHELADFEAVGAAGSAEVAMARSLISKCSVRVLCQQDPEPLRRLRDTIGLTDTECNAVGSWADSQLGYGLWKIGTAGSYVVRVILSDPETSCLRPTSE